MNHKHCFHVVTIDGYAPDMLNLSDEDKAMHGKACYVEDYPSLCCHCGVNQSQTKEPL